MPHLHVAAKVLDLLWEGEDEEIPDLAKVGGMTRLVFEPSEQLDREALQPNVGFHGELLADPARALAGRLRAKGFALEEQDIDVAPGQLVRKRAAHDPAACDDDAQEARNVAAVHRQLSDAHVRILVVDGHDVTTVCHAGRTVTAHVQSALGRDPSCVAPGCDVALGLENHHWDVPYAECGTSTLAGLARLCQWHHELVTYDGYELTGGAGSWEMRAPPAGQFLDFDTG